MSCLHRITPAEIVVVGNDLSPLNPYQDYVFRHLQWVESEGQAGTACTGARNYTIGERIGRVVAGILLTLLTGFVGLLVPQIRSLFHAEHRITVWHNPASMGLTMSIYEGKIQLMMRRAPGGGDGNGFSTPTRVGSSSSDDVSVDHILFDT